MKKLPVGNLALAAATLAASLIAAEATLRWADYDYRPLTISARDDFRDTLPFREEHFEFDSQLLWRPRAGYRIFNAQGFRGPLVGDTKAPREIRIFTVGDSNTLGWKGDDGANWPGFLAELAGPTVRVVNAGVWGYTSFQGVGRLEDVLVHSPDIVTISFGSNDAHPVRVADADRAGSGGAAPWLRSIVGDHRVGRLLIGSVDRLRSLLADNETIPRVSLDNYRHNLRTMVSRVRKEGALPVLMTRPHLGVPESATEWLAAAPDYNEAVVEVARELDTPLIDFHTLFKHREEHFADAGHFTVEGNRLAARLAWDELRQWIDGSPR